MTSTAKIYGQDLRKLTESNLLAKLHIQVTANSGGLPAAGALPQDDALGSFVWTATDGMFLLFEEDELMLDEAGEFLLTES